jgi:hypothetical protein
MGSVDSDGLECWERRGASPSYVICGSGNCSSAPTPQMIARADAITAFINNITFSPVPLVYSCNRDFAATNGEELALQWLIDKDPLQLSSSDTFRLQQRYALFTLLSQQTVPKQPWRYTTGWLKYRKECLWYGITCSTKSVVTRIDLTHWRQLQATIPADIGLLTSLTGFIVTGNYLTGTLPSSIGRWTSLEYFDVRGNGLTGTLPSSIGREWTHIKRAFFQGNFFKGTIPSGICGARFLYADCISEVVCTCPARCTCF